MPTEKIQIVKLPATEQNEDSEQPKAFPKMPRLYLELLENKKKIKPELVNKEYIPKDDLSADESVASAVESVTSISVAEFDKHDSSSNNSPLDTPKHTPRHPTPPTPTPTPPSNHTPNNHRHGTNRHGPKTQRYTPVDSASDNEQQRRRSTSIHSDSDSTISSTSRSSRSSSGYRKKDDTISSRLQELLENDNEETADIKPKKSTTIRIPPSLSDLEKAGKVHLKKEPQEVTGMSDQDQEDNKREYLYKFEILQKSYKTAKIPEFTIHSDFQSVKRAYEDTLRMLTLDQTVDDYKRYMTMGFGAVEFVLGSIFNFDMAGYAAQQQLNMNSYERLLVELGEKSYVPTGSKYSVEIRLLFVIIINTAFFLISKIILKKTGVNLGNTTQSQQPQSQQPTQKRKMRGPVVNVDDIPDSISTDDKVVY